MTLSGAPKRAYALAPAAKEFASLDVRVTLDGEPVQGALVALRRGDGPVIAVRAKDGGAFFGNFPPGEYRLRVTADGLATRDLAVVLEKDRTTAVTVPMAPEPLQPVPDEPAAPGD